MDSLVQDRIYKKIAVYDYQGACSNSKNHYNGNAYKIKPFDPMRHFFKWLLHIAILLFNKMESVYGTAIAYAQEKGI